MKIANFREYTNILRELYAGDTMAELGQYYNALISSGKELTQNKQHLQSEITKLNQQIDTQAAIVRTSLDKKRAGIELNKLKKMKQDKVQALKTLQSSDHFNTLSNDTKACVCSGFLFQKYLTDEIIQNNPLHFATDTKGDLIVVPEKLRQSELYNQAIHIKDFVFAYITNNPDKVKTPGHFKTMLNNAKDWQSLLEFANLYFAKLNAKIKLSPNQAETSLIDTEVIFTPPQSNFLLVKLLSPQALDYESQEMHHCVGSGSYDKSVTEGKTAIYSLRTTAPNGRQIPHATIEITKGKIAQIKGNHDKEIKKEYIPPLHQCLSHLLSHRDIFGLSDLKSSTNLSTYGFIIDTNNEPIDLFNPPTEINVKNLDSNSVVFDYIQPSLLSVEKLNFITNSITEGTIQRLKSFRHLGMVEFQFTPQQPLPNQLRSRELLLQYIPDHSLSNLKQKLGRNILQHIGFIFDTSDNLHDLFNLKQEIEVKTINLTDLPAHQIPKNLIFTPELHINSVLDDNIFASLKRFKRIDKININNARKNVIDPLKTREFMFNLFNTHDLSDKLDFQSLYAIGFNYAWEDTKACHTTPQTTKQNPLSFIDIINPKPQSSVCFINSDNPSYQYTKYPNIKVQFLSINGCSDHHIITSVNSFAGIQKVSFSNCDFSAVSELDLSGIKFIPNTSDDPNSLAITIFNEELSVSKTVTEYAISLTNCTHLPSADHIRFPSNLKHLYIAPSKQEKTTLPDFSRYQELESLQLNNLDLSANHVIHLPPNIKYLAFYNCQFGSHQHMDLSAFKQLEEFHLNRCNLKGIDKITLPQNLTKWEASEATFNPNCDMPSLKPKQIKLGFHILQREI